MNIASNPSSEFKVVVLGDAGVGKTCIVLRYINGVFSSVQQSTIGAFFLTKKMTAPDGSLMKMQLWDTAGQERFRAMASMYYKGAACAVVCFDITNEASFSKTKDWIDELRRNTDREEIFLVIACTKMDLEEQRVVSKTRCQQYASSVGAFLFETSAKQDKGINELFEEIAVQVHARKKALPSEERENIVLSASNNSIKSNKARGMCC